MYKEMLKNLAPKKGIPVIPVQIRLPVDLHSRVQRAVGELMIHTGQKVSANTVYVALLADGLDRLEAGGEDQDNGSGSL